LQQKKNVDDLGFPVELRHQPRRIVSLVPSWTETLFSFGLAERIVAVTRFCAEPADAVGNVLKIGGTKNPDVGAIVRLNPDLVVANAEENRRQDIESLRSAGLPVFTTFPRTVAGALESTLRLGAVLGCEAQASALARDIVGAVSEIEAGLGIWSKFRLRVFCPVWKNPWVVFNADTYAHDVLRMLGFHNIFASAGERYPRTTIEDAIGRQLDLVLLPDEPYKFRPRDVEQLKAELPAALARRVLVVSGRDLHWYGVHMVEGLRALNKRLSRVRASVITSAGNRYR
jgi:ABC-type Fe3+-hydroxamate transport system substrate-binding protein